jgi:pimeloyl-ACP methyl ester carboxylesterase
MPLFRVFNGALEKDFIVVNWGQRGTGKSYSSRLDLATLTMERMREDIGELVDRLRAEFRQDRVMLVCHSWGTLLCLEHMARRPETVAAYVGVGQAVNVPQSDRMGSDWALGEALRAGNQRDAAALRALGSPPYSLEEVDRQRSYIWKYGGAFRRGRSDWDLILVALRAREVSWPDYFAFVRGSSLSSKALWPTVQRFDARTDHPRVGAPTYLFLGRHDYNTSSKLAAEYFDRLEAPRKELVWFENSAHFPPFEESERFNAEIRRVAMETGLLPRVVGASDSQSSSQ